MEIMALRPPWSSGGRGRRAQGSQDRPQCFPLQIRSPEFPGGHCLPLLIAKNQIVKRVSASKGWEV